MRKKVFAGLFLSMMGGLLCQMAALGAIPKDAVQYNGHSYRYYEALSWEPYSYINEDGETVDVREEDEYGHAKYSWEEAKKICEDMGGHLVTISDYDENRYGAVKSINKAIEDGRVICPKASDGSPHVDDVYIGLHDIDGDGVWNWVTGEATKPRTNYDYSWIPVWGNWDETAPEYFSDLDNSLTPYWECHYAVMNVYDKVGRLTYHGLWLPCPSKAIARIWDEQGDLIEKKIIESRNYSTGFICEWDYIESANEDEEADSQKTTGNTGTIQKGDTFTYNQGMFKVTETGTTITVEFCGPLLYMKKTQLKVPNTVTKDGKTCKVTSIAPNACKNNKTVKSVIIGSNVKKIGKNAFLNCTGLKKITLPASITSIGSSAFQGCKKLGTVTIKSLKLTAKTIGKNAFKGTSKKLVIKVPKKAKNEYKKFLKKKGNNKAKIK